MRNKNVLSASLNKTFHSFIVCSEHEQYTPLFYLFFVDRKMDISLWRNSLIRSILNCSFRR